MSAEFETMNDKPQYRIDWLESLINKCEALNEFAEEYFAEEYSVNVEAGSPPNI